MMSQNTVPSKLFFASDYMEGAHPLILKRLMETNLVHSAGYGTDEFSESARAKIRKACNAPDADIHFLVGGTQANATVIKSILRPYQGVIAAETGHVSTHEAGAIEAGGHKVITLPHKNGKLDADSIERCIQGYWDDANHEHMVMPGLVYISQPTEFGTLYSLEELTKISEICPKLYRFLRDKEIETVMIVRISASHNTFGYLMCAEPHTLRIWQQDDCATLFSVGRMLAGYIQGRNIDF
jgi:threonine aldolase